MIDHIISSAGGHSQSLHEMGPLRDSASKGIKPEPDEKTLNLIKIMSHDIRSSLLSMLATLKLLNRGYYGKMDEEAAHKIKDLLSSATRLTGIVDACLGGTLEGNEEVKIGGPNSAIENCERNNTNKQVSVEAKGNALIL
jgi:light-regulated signal transduction histidine kinase (bacteriophytochrome)